MFGEPNLRDRRGRPSLLRRPDVGIRTPARTQEVRAPRARSDSPAFQPVVGTGHASVRSSRPQADRQHPPSHRRHGSLGSDRIQGPPPVGYREAIAAALRTHDEVEDWADTSAASGARFAYSLRINVNPSPERVFAPIRGIGGSTGRYYAHWLWRLHGVVDIWMGGPGLSRGRRHPDQLEVGDIAVCWRVETYETNHLLRLAARMKVPGRDWLEFRVDTDGSNSEMRQAAVFDPRGILGGDY